MKRTLLITGASGYLGQLVTEALSKEGSPEHIIATDIAPPPNPLPEVEYHTLDVRSSELASLIRNRPIHTVIHLAAIVSPGADEKLAFQVDVEGTRNVLDACVEGGVSRIIVTSSGAAYGYHADNDPLLTEDSPLRGNDAFAYSRNKRLVEEMLAEYRDTHSELAQLVLRPCTILGATVRNQITALFEKPVVLGLHESATPFTFIWDQDVVACIVDGARNEKSGVYNLAGDGVMTLREIALHLGKPYLSLPKSTVQAALSTLHALKWSQYGPEQTLFLEHRPVMSNERLKHDFGYRPQLTSRQVFELYLSRRTSHAQAS